MRYVELDPNQIILKRDERQRKVLKDIDSLAESIRRSGQIQPIVIDRDNVLIAGERRLTAIKQLGDRNIQCVYKDDLSEFDRQLLEYEENIARVDLTWQDQCLAFHGMHNLLKGNNPKWTSANSAERLGISAATASDRLAVAAELIAGNQMVADAALYSTAKNIVSRIQSRKADAEKSLLEGIIKSKPAVTPLEEAIAKTMPSGVAGIYPEDDTANLDYIREMIESGLPSGLILNDDFIAWSADYEGPKFNLVHCDFPYGVGMHKSDQGSGDNYGTYNDSPDIYWSLVDALLNNLDNFASDSMHLVFWFSMDYYQPTLDRLRSKFIVNPFPLIWVKSDNSGILPDANRGPRRTYETAFLATRGDRKIVKAVSNHVAAGIQKGNHMSEKPQEVLQHFFRMLVDETTSILDPTCGSGSAIRAARTLGASELLGIEINSEFAERAEELLKLEDEFNGVQKDGE